MATRRRPFSAKQKKLQLQAKRQEKHKQEGAGRSSGRRGGTHDDDEEDEEEEDEVEVNAREDSDGADADGAPAQPKGKDTVAAAGASKGRAPAKPKDTAPVSERLRSVFEKEPRDIIEKRIEQSRLPYRHLLPAEAFEADLEDFYGPEAVIDIPKRPQWTYGQSKATVEGNEAAMFRAWLSNIYAKYPVERLSFFEHNLEVWRQLWRVAEMSDIVLLIVDIRFPLVHFPPALYQWIIHDMKRQLVLVLNKIDLVSTDVVQAWDRYFRAKFPGLHVATFSCYPAEVFAFNDLSDEANLKKRTNVHRRRYHRSVGVRDVLTACRDVDLVKNNVPVDWAALVDRYSKEAAAADANDESSDDDGSGSEDGGDGGGGGGGNDGTNDGDGGAAEQHDGAQPFQQGMPHPDLVTIGLVGHPNVGKSSLINGLLGKKVVSASRTPGHTKHFQTIHLTENVRVTDCPGLVFPSLLPKPLQILAGMYNIAQVNEPYSVVQFLAERVPLPELLDLIHPALLPEWQEDAPTGPVKSNAQLRQRPHPPWTAWAICEAFAIKKGFYTARAGRPDAYRAANMILRLAADGRILLSQKPRGFYRDLATRATAATEVSRHHVYPIPGLDAEATTRVRNSSVQRAPTAAADEDEDEDEGDDDEDDVRRAPTKGVRNAFAALAALGGDDEEDEDEDEDD